MDDSLTGELGTEIGRNGPMPFALFMRAALYHPRHGYYASRVPGHGGDYSTSASLSPWFGALVARELESMWEALGRPDPFTVVEVGAGRGDLAAGALEAAGPMAGALRWRLVEQFDGVAELQRGRLGPAAASVEWSRRLGERSAATGCVLAHEVLDNFPVHLVEMGAGGEAHEVYVDLEAGRLVERLGPLSSRDLLEPARAAAAQLGPGSRLEVCLDLKEWCEEASAALRRGYLLIVDYGDVEPDLWQRNPRGTIVTYGPDGFGEDPLADPGRRDVTADVNFSAVRRLAGHCGFAPQLFTSQRSWLRSLGLDDVATRLERAADDATARGRHEEALAMNGELSGLLALTGHMGLGDMMVFRGAKDAPSPGSPGQVRTMIV